MRRSLNIWLFVIALLSGGIPLSAQDVKPDSAALRRIDFVNYLIGKQEYKDAAFLLEQESSKLPAGSSVLSDTVFHLLGWSYYSQKELLQSRNAFEKVSPKSASYLKCRMFSAYNSAFLGDTAHAARILDGLSGQESWEIELIHFQKAGLNLLKRDLPAYQQDVTFFTYRFFPLVAEEQRFGQMADVLRTRKDKSMVLAALYSSLLPGSGKVYAGKTGEGVSSFLILTVLGLITWENYQIGRAQV